MTIPSSSNASQPIVELYDDGDFTGHATTTSNNKWEYLLEDLTEGTHIMTAKSDGIESEPRIIQILASSGSEDWKGFEGRQLTTQQIYFGKSGLAFYVTLAEANAGGKRLFQKSQ